MMSSAGIPLRVIQEISGHNDLGTLQRYLEVSPEQKRRAVAASGF
jgi:integrase/recombinase XerD